MKNIIKKLEKRVNNLMELIEDNFEIIKEQKLQISSLKENINDRNTKSTKSNKSNKITEYIYCKIDKTDYKYKDNVTKVFISQKHEINDLQKALNQKEAEIKVLKEMVQKGFISKDFS